MLIFKRKSIIGKNTFYNFFFETFSSILKNAAKRTLQKLYCIVFKKCCNRKIVVAGGTVVAVKKGVARKCCKTFCSVFLVVL